MEAARAVVRAEAREAAVEERLPEVGVRQAGSTAARGVGAKAAGQVATRAAPWAAGPEAATAAAVPEAVEEVPRAVLEGWWAAKVA